jgi:hypothetical protein
MKIKVHFLMTYPRGGNKCISINIRDATSGELLLDAEISPEAWLDIMSSTHAEINGDTSSNLDRVGKKHSCESFAFPIQDGDGKYPSRLKAEIAKLLNAGWHEVDAPRRNNQSQWVLVARKWS